MFLMKVHFGNKYKKNTARKNKTVFFGPISCEFAHIIFIVFNPFTFLLFESLKDEKSLACHTAPAHNFLARKIYQYIGNFIMFSKNICFI